MKHKLSFLTALLITLSACTQNKTVQPLPHPGSKQLAKYSIATFAAGCFWHEEAMFESIKGVKEAVSGYAGGTTSNPTYESIEAGNTGHAETVNVYYDSLQIDFPTLLKIYFAGQDATQVNGQGPDRGTQYRSLVFFRNIGEKQIIEKYMRQIQPHYSKPLAAQVLPFTRFWEAEKYHQNYIEHNPNTGYVQRVSIPEIKKLQRQFPTLVKPGFTY